MLKPIPDFPDYFASKNGNVWSTKQSVKPTMLTKQLDTWGYHHVILHRDGQRHTIKVARLMLITFSGKPREGMIACHGKRGRKNDSMQNLYWGTYFRNNGEDRIRDGTALIGQFHPRSKLNESQVRIIVRCRQMGMKKKHLQDIFHISFTQIKRICNGHSWSYLYT